MQPDIVPKLAPRALSSCFELQKMVDGTELPSVGGLMHAAHDKH